MANLAIGSAVSAPRSNPTTQHEIARLFGSRGRVLKRSATQFEDDEEPQALGEIDLVPAVLILAFNQRCLRAPIVPDVPRMN